jgi:hypothetical protein
MKEKNQNGKSQLLHIYNIRIVCHFFTGTGLPVDILNSNPDSKEIDDGRFYFAGDIRFVSAVLVFR